MSWRLTVQSTCVALAAVFLSQTSTRISAQEPSLADMLARAAREAAAFADPARMIACEERYKQIAVRVRAIVGFATSGGVGASSQVEGVPIGSREWTAELAVVATPDNEQLGQPWMEFRDILAVDAKPVRNGVSRLGALATASFRVAGPEALTITRETVSLRYGAFGRGALLPRLIQLFFHSSNQKRFDLKKAGARVINGVKTMEVKFQEKTTPTIFGASNGADTFCAGSAWIDPETGRVQLSLLKNGDSSSLRDEMTVTYGLDQATGLWLPKELKDLTIDDEEGTRVEGVGTFTKWRIVPRTAR